MRPPDKYVADCQGRAVGLHGLQPLADPLQLCGTDRQRRAVRQYRQRRWRAMPSWLTALHGERCLHSSLLGYNHIQLLL